MSTIHERRRGKLTENKLRRFKDPDGVLTTHFQGRSYALTPEGEFVPLMLRHMRSEHWQQLFWLQPRVVVIEGREYKSLCTICRQAFECLRRKEDYKFECTASGTTLDLEAT
jgi:hypothetical protein